MSSELPYPNGYGERIRALEDRARNTEATMATVVTTQAVQNEQHLGVKEDIAEIKGSLRRLTQMAWGLFLVLVAGIGALVVQIVQTAAS